MSLGSFILVQVGRAILRVRPEKFAATLRRFKGAKEIKNLPKTTTFIRVSRQLNEVYS